MLRTKITEHYEKHDCTRICQGDILRDFAFYIVGKDKAQVKIFFPYVTIISQDCDLEHGIKIEKTDPNDDGFIEFNQYLPSVLITPGFPADQIKAGDHLKDFSIKPKNIASDIWKRIKSNNDARYHFLPSDVNNQVPDLVIDFKSYFTLPFAYLIQHYESSYLSTINELFRENLSQRFSFYLSRIAIPEL